MSSTTGNTFLGKDGIERDKETGEHTRDSSLDGKVEFSLCANGKANNDQGQAQHGTEGCRNSQEDSREEYVEDNGEDLGHIVKGDFDILETEIVEGNHCQQRQERVEEFSWQWKTENSALGNCAKKEGLDEERDGDGAFSSVLT